MTLVFGAPSLDTLENLNGLEQQNWAASVEFESEVLSQEFFNVFQLAGLVSAIAQTFKVFVWASAIDFVKLFLFSPR